MVAVGRQRKRHWRTTPMSSGEKKRKEERKQRSTGGNRPDDDTVEQLFIRSCRCRLDVVVNRRGKKNTIE